MLRSAETLHVLLVLHSEFSLHISRVQERLLLIRDGQKIQAITCVFFIYLSKIVKPLGFTAVNKYIYIFITVYIRYGLKWRLRPQNIGSRIYR